MVNALNNQNMNKRLSTHSLEKSTMKILVVEDHQLVRDGLKHIFADTFEDYIYLEANNAVNARRLAEENPDINLVILDLKVPGANGFDLLGQLNNLLENSPIIVLSAEESTTLIYGAISRGASGYVPKSFSHEQLCNAISVVLKGGVFVPDAAKSAIQYNLQAEQLVENLTSRQLEIVGLLAQGKTNKEIAALLHLSAATIRSYLTIIFRQMKVSNRTEAVYIARQLGLVND